VQAKTSSSAVSFTLRSVEELERYTGGDHAKVLAEATRQMPHGEKGADDSE